MKAPTKFDVDLGVVSAANDAAIQPCRKVIPG